MRNTDHYVIAWKCWYEISDQIVEFDSTKDSLEFLPEDGFQAMKLWYSDGTGRVIIGTDYYFFVDTPNGIIFGQSNDTDILVRYPGAFVKRGKHVADALIKTIQNLMMNSVNPLSNAN